MPSKIRHGLLISLAIIGLFFMSAITSYSGTNYVYDELNRLIRVEYEDGTIIEYTYDGAGNRLTLSVTGFQESVSIPSIPTGPASGITGTSYAYTTGESSSNLSHSVQYLFDWGNGTNSGWLPVGQTSDSKSWSLGGNYNVKARARCSIHTSKVSPWSDILLVAISPPDTIPPTGTVTINSGAAIANNPSVTLSLSCSDNVGCNQMLFSNDNVTYSTPEAYATTKSWTLSAGDGIKTVYAKFKDQAGNWSIAYSDTINLRTYDLLITAVSGPTTGNITQQITVMSTAKNQGGSTTSAFRVGIYLSTDATITTSDIFLGYASVSSLTGGGQSTLNTTVRIPSNTAAGAYYIGAIADYANAIIETNETNNGFAGNQITITAVSPDLVMTSVSGPGTANITQQITVTRTVKNQGGTTSGFSVGIYLSQDAVITTSDTRIGATSVGSLAENSQTTLNTSVRIPANAVAGMYYIGAIADYVNAVSESNETNNSLVGNQITITAVSPDLMISSVSGPTNGNKGRTIAVTCTVRNQGGGTGGFNVGVYLSTDPNITTADTRIGSWSISSLVSGGERILSGNLTIPSTLATGVYYIGAIADYGNAVTESNEGNNALTSNQITVSP